MGRIISTREPGPERGPLFSLIRDGASCAWAVRSDVPDEIAVEIDLLAGDEPVISDFRQPPVHASRYLSLLGGIGSLRESGGTIKQSGGPAFEFPEAIPKPANIVMIDDEECLHENFRGWTDGEIADGRAPVLAVLESGSPVSICFCARSSNHATEAGVETAEAFRGRGFAACVTAAWALAIRESGRVPLYSTSWTNDASLAVARKLGLVIYASSWNLSY